MDEGKKELYIMSRAILEFCITSIRVESTRGIYPSAIIELRHFAKQGVKVRLK